MKKILPIIAIFAIILSSCGVKKTVSVIISQPPTTEQVQILGIGQQIPDGAILLGTISVGTTGFTSRGRCTYDRVLNYAITQAQAIGGNIMQIRLHTAPTPHNLCHEITVDVYTLPN